MNNQYLVPANSKKSLLIFGMFRKIDFIIALVGVGLTAILSLTINLNSVSGILIALIPLILAATLVAPLPNYHNLLQFLTNLFNFFSKRRTYLWKGWSFIDEQSSEDTSQKSK